MADNPFQRARSPEQKAHRRRAILEAAAALLAEGGIEATTLAAIAERAGLVKSNLYRYFESREEILMWLFVEDLGEA
ncbi:MAG TPA: helix-turn-helix domain-containing protein, partial [Paracoccaceae bacterium]|nr:helix-turn-helix domain-containing protein [Paracoccaceae bacterium]